MTGPVGSMPQSFPGRFIEDLTWPEVRATEVREVRQASG